MGKTARKQQLKRATKVQEKIACFNVWFDGKEHTLILHEGESAEFGYNCLNEEGYSYAHEEFFFDGKTVHRESEDGGRDCDGEVRRDYSFTWDVGSMVDDSGYPMWELLNEHNYDQYAQMSNY